MWSTCRTTLDAALGGEGRQATSTAPTTPATIRRAAGRLRDWDVKLLRRISGLDVAATRRTIQSRNRVMSAGVQNETCRGSKMRLVQSENLPSVPVPPHAGDSPTGEPYAGDRHVRFGGRGGRHRPPYPDSRENPTQLCLFALGRRRTDSSRKPEGDPRMAGTARMKKPFSAESSSPAP